MFWAACMLSNTQPINEQHLRDTSATLHPKLLQLHALGRLSRFNLYIA